jgi:hypothetical protein
MYLKQPFGFKTRNNLIPLGIDKNGIYSRVPKSFSFFDHAYWKPAPDGRLARLLADLGTHAYSCIFPGLSYCSTTVLLLF